MADNVVEFHTRDRVIGEGVVLSPRSILESLMADMDSGAVILERIVVVGVTEGQELDVRGSHGAPEMFWLCHKGAEALLRSPAMDG